jgi:hypothetical protein
MSSVSALCHFPSSYRFSFLSQTEPNSSARSSLLSSCAGLFSSHYGCWSTDPANEAKLKQFRLKSGTRVKMTPERLANDLLFDCSCDAALIHHFPSGELVGHAFFCTFEVSDLRDSTSNLYSNLNLPYLTRWITQLVIHSDHRGKKLSVFLLSQALFDRPTTRFSSVGLVSSHPAAIRALESATNMRCSIRNGNFQLIPKVLKSVSVPYLSHQSDSFSSFLTLSHSSEESSDTCWLDTQFFVDHSEVLHILKQECSNNGNDPNRSWALGSPLPEGSEFVAFVQFHQPRKSSK